MPSDKQPEPRRDQPEPEEQSFWDAYWERFHRQQVDDPVERRREGLWERFRRQEVDDPVRRRGARSRS